MVCDHPGCTGRHGSNVRKLERCPAALERDRLRQAAIRLAYANGSKVKQARVTSTYNRDKMRLDAPMIYVVLGDTWIKIGITATKYRMNSLGDNARALGLNGDYQVIWNQPGSPGLEIFLHGLAGLKFTPLPSKGTRQSEWYERGQETVQSVLATVKLWMEVYDDLRQAYAASDNAQNAIIHPVDQA